MRREGVKAGTSRVSVARGFNVLAAESSLAGLDGHVTPLPPCPYDIFRDYTVRGDFLSPSLLRPLAVSRLPVLCAGVRAVAEKLSLARTASARPRWRARTNRCQSLSLESCGYGHEMGVRVSFFIYIFSLFIVVVRTLAWCFVFVYLPDNQAPIIYLLTNFIFPR